MNDNKLRDLLGIYFDSAEDNLSKIPDTVYFTLKGKMTGVSRGQIVYAWDFTFNNEQTLYNINPLVAKTKVLSMGYSTTEIPEIINEYIPDFSVRSNQHSSSMEKYSSEISFTAHGQTHKTTKVVRSLDEFFVEYVSFCLSKNLCIDSLVINVKMTRETNEAYRRQVFASRRTDKYRTKAANLEEWFGHMTASGAQPHRYKSNRLVFNGFINQSIANKSKEVTLFLIEYLYGKKITKAKSVHQIHCVLAGLDGSDFGIKDAQQMIKLLDVISSYHYDVKTIHNNLSAINIKPALNLKRWDKKLVDKIPQTVQNNTQTTT